MSELNKPVGQIATERPESISLFQQFGIDYYCRGRRSLREACESVGLDPVEILHAISELPPPVSSDNPMHRNWNEPSLRDLMRFITDRCHAPNRAKAARIGQELKQVAETHKESRPELRRVLSVFNAIVRIVIPHMTKEEDLIFPLIDALENDREDRHLAGFAGSLTNQMLLEFHEHDVLAEKLRTLRELSSNFATPADACMAFRAVMHDLREWERVLQWHMHLENNILLVRASELEASQRKQPAELW